MRPSETTGPSPAPTLVPPSSFITTWLGWLAVLALLGPLPLWLIDPLVGLGATAAGVGVGIPLGVGWIAGRRVDRVLRQRLAAFERGDCLAHWRLADDEWHRLAWRDWQPARGQPWSGLLLGLLMGGSAGLGLGLLLPGLAGGAALGVLGGWLVRRSAWRNYQERLRQPGEVYLGQNTVYYPGRCESWAMAGIYLTDVRLLPGPPACLEFTIRTRRPLYPTGRHTFQVPVPVGRETEARQLIASWLGKDSGGG